MIGAPRIAFPAWAWQNSGNAWHCPPAVEQLGSALVLAASCHPTSASETMQRPLETVSTEPKKPAQDFGSYCFLPCGTHQPCTNFHEALLLLADGDPSKGNRLPLNFKTLLQPEVLFQLRMQRRRRHHDWPQRSNTSFGDIGTSCSFAGSRHEFDHSKSPRNPLGAPFVPQKRSGTHARNRETPGKTEHATPPTS